MAPAWVLSFDEDEKRELEEAEAQGRLLPPAPRIVHKATHNYMPTPKENAGRGGVFDHKRERSPVTLSTSFESSASKWHKFMVASFGREHSEEGHVVDQPWLEEHMPDLEKPASSGYDENAIPQNMKYLLFTADGRQLLRTKIRVCQIIQYTYKFAFIDGPADSFKENHSPKSYFSACRSLDGAYILYPCSWFSSLARKQFFRQPLLCTYLFDALGNHF